MTIDNQNDFRLSYDVVPRRYQLRFAPDFETLHFSGDVSIEVEITNAVDRIVLNADELSITDAQISRGWDESSNEQRQALEIEFVPELERVSLIPAKSIAKGRYRIQANFAGEINDKLRGFYRSVFTDEQGGAHTIATTQFEETHARRAFPCFDEPDRKAIFSITLDVPSRMLGLSNGPAVEETGLPAGGLRVRFGDTIAMSTYLVAFVIGPLEVSAPVDVDGVALRVAHVPGKGHLIQPALEVAEHALRWYSSYFGIAYPGEKLDLVALPDFAAGAMENLGCVTFRDAILLADPKSISRSEMERLTEVVEHEIAHMWFGDLVTMDWWNGIWLNEAFATFMSLCCMDDFRPEWECFVGFSRDRAGAFTIDGLHNTRPIEFPVLHPDEAAAMFDVLTYEKGASVLWMIETYLGRDRFRAGVRRYLQAHQFANAKTTDLWDAIEAEAGDVPIREVMDSWIFQGGYPLVSVVRSSTSTTDQIELSQEPFSYLPKSAEIASTIGDGWLVPVIATTIRADSSPSRLLLGDDSMTLAVDPGTVVVNAGGSGFYRVSYDEVLRNELIAHYAQLAALERQSLFADAWAANLARRKPLQEFASLLTCLPNERDPYVWSVALGAFSTIDLLAQDDNRESFASFVNAICSSVLRDLGWGARASEGEQVPLLRSSIIGTLGIIAHNKEVIEIARDLVAKDIRDQPGLDPNLAATLLSIVAAHASDEEFNEILARYRDPRDPMDEVRHLNALSSLEDVGLASKVHEMCLDEVRSQNAPYLLGSMFRNRSIGPTTWDFVTDHFEEIRSRFPDNSIHRMLDGVAGLAQVDEAGSPLYANDVKVFCDEHITGARRRLVAQTLERLEVNVAFARTLTDELGALLSPS